MTAASSRVVIVGGGPNGITAAHYMALYGIDCVVIEASAEIPPFPRAVGMDDEGLRVLQTVAMAERALRDMISNVPLRYYNARGICFAEVKPSSARYGWPMRNIFMQHLLEETLRDALFRHRGVDLRLGHEMVSLHEQDDGVTLTVRDATGKPYDLRADYVIGADGGRSSVRKQLGIQLLGVTHPRKWVVVDTANDMIDAPYTALHADPRRPFVCIYLPYRQRRWEFMLMEHENEEAMCDEANIRGLIRDHIGQDADRLEIVRIRAYTHNSRVAETFVKGRVSLIGDAAHISPPWAGQGLNSGLRDVANLCWKVAAVLLGRADPSIISTYDLERRGHATDLVSLADNMGAILGLTDPLAAGIRDWMFQAVGTVESLRTHLLEFKFKPEAVIGKGLVHRANAITTDTDPVGRLFVQPTVEITGGARVRFDDVLGPWYSIIGYRVNPADHVSNETVAYWATWETRFIQVNRSRSGPGHGQMLSAPNTTCVEDVDNRLSDWFDTHHCNIAIIRPDRFVAAATTPEHLDATLKALAAQLGRPNH